MNRKDIINSKKFNELFDLNKEMKKKGKIFEDEDGIKYVKINYDIHFSSINKTYIENRAYDNGYYDIFFYKLPNNKKQDSFYEQIRHTDFEEGDFKNLLDLNTKYKNNKNMKIEYVVFKKNSLKSKTGIIIFQNN